MSYLHANGSNQWLKMDRLYHKLAIKIISYAAIIANI